MASEGLAQLRFRCHISGMTQNTTERRKTSFRRETGGYLPRTFTLVSRERFLRDRRQRHLRRVSGRPSEAQVAMAQSLALEWAALSARARYRLAEYYGGVLAAKQATTEHIDEIPGRSAPLRASIPGRLLTRTVRCCPYSSGPSRLASP
jgi:hypothetical protein